MQTSNDLKWFGMAIHRYYKEHGSYPPATVQYENSALTHSWRSVLQHHLSKAVETKDDFDAYDFNEPWNSPANLDTAKNHRFGDHWYQFLAVTGPDTAWGKKTSEITDGTANTVLVIGIRNSGVSWNEPKDFVFDGKNLTLDGQPIQLSKDVFVLQADTSVDYFADGIPNNKLKPLLTANGGD
jgi:hypothetical protein